MTILVSTALIVGAIVSVVMARRVGRHNAARANARSYLNR